MWGLRRCAWGWCGPEDSRRGQQLRLAELNGACDGIDVAMGLGFILCSLVYSDVEVWWCLPQHTSYPLRVSGNTSWWHKALKAALLTNYVIGGGKDTNMGFHTFIKGKAEG